MSDPIEPRPTVIFVDLETTGLDPDRDAITEIGWAFADGDTTIVRHRYVRYDGLPSVWSALHTKAWPRERRHELPPDGHEIGPREVELDVAIGEFFHACITLARRFGGPVYMAGVDPAFDHSFLRKTMREVPYDPRPIDVGAMAMGAFGWSTPRPLALVREALDVPAKNPKPSDAAEDALEAMSIYEALLAHSRRTRE